MGRNMGGQVVEGYTNEGAKRSSKTTDIVSYALEVSVYYKWCHVCGCSPFQSSHTF